MLSGTVIATARHAGELGETVSLGPRMENSWPLSADASMFAEMIWPWRIVTAVIRPTTRAVSETVPLALTGSSGRSRIVTSSALTAWRAGIPFTATTTEIVLSPECPACCWA